MPTAPELQAQCAAADVKAVEPEGATAELGCISSGFGGLGLDGMIGSELTGGFPALPPGLGNTGIASGASAGAEAENSGMEGRSAGAAEMAKVFGARGKE
ncbi:hypothetical protein BHM03_00043036 [Ensete ventricosum]|nr:hypothetical protein BHM03_00043036 [Ensete ventricosum]